MGVHSAPTTPNALLVNHNDDRNWNFPSHKEESGTATTIEITSVIHNPKNTGDHPNIYDIVELFHLTVKS